MADMKVSPGCYNRPPLKNLSWPLFPSKRKVATRNITRFHWWNVSPTEPCMMTTSGWKNSPPDHGWLSTLQMTSLPAKGYLRGTRRGSVFKNIPGTCIQCLKVFDPFMNCWQLLAIEVYVRVASQAKGGNGAKVLDQRAPESWLDHRTSRPERRNGPEFQEKLRQLY